MNLCYIEKRFNHLELLKKFVKSNVNLMKIKSIEDLKYDDLLIISNEDSSYEEIIKKVPNAFVWEKIYKDVYIYSLDRYMTNYDFYHLKYSLQRALKPENQAIAVGSSYALFGIEESVLNTPCVNLALASQDIYYACVVGRYVINQNKNIKKIFIGTGYYTFYNDLSLSKGGELMRLTDVYYPIFRDKHNCEELLKSEIPILYEHEIFDMEQITEICCKEFFEESNGKYFTDIKDRFKSRVVIRGPFDTKWHELNTILQEEAAYERAESHNKAIRYIDSCKENIKILNSFITFCNERNVIVYLIAFPNTKFYKKYLLEDYKKSYMSALNSIEGEINFIDLNTFDIFDDKDFVDMDHLDKSGAIKASNIINSLSS